ncbi:hypothetical protein DSC45_06595 [Streptomyces sp. YIM 130001]|uniref:hypothetical protein n=1 Tax=Streptomyces sp. YIM 130001 TaxID=2259644 RepID=UPI000EEC45F5|nr:hypothetical protein [Streptomyces sp. YIM 130001]RII19664.1 hypothetical protein DSC45_06595 [Streptomyces sp. YIM 130001]
MKITRAALPTAPTRHPGPHPTPQALYAAPRPDPAPAAPPWDLVTVPARHGLEAVDILRRRPGPALGPVLHDRSCDTLGFLVPPGTAERWNVPGSACTQTCARPAHTRTEQPPVAGTSWLLAPADSAPVTDPDRLRRALGEAARIIETGGPVCG